jgi:threonine dehydratase
MTNMLTIKKDMTLIPPEAIAKAHARLEPHIHETPLVESQLLNEWLGNRILFKVEAVQKIGAFKIRGALNALLSLKERGELPKWVVAHSSGNHSQAVACAAKMLGVRATIYLPAATSPIKQQATRGYGAEVIVKPTRQEAEEAVYDDVKKGAFFLPPYDHDDVIAGQGTSCYEALQTGLKPDAVFLPCGGGGFLSGTWLATQLLSPKTKVIGAEPKTGNDAVQSLKAGHVVKLSEAPVTIADGVVTLAVAERTFQYLQKIEAMLEIEEEKTIYWTQWLMHLLKITVEPTAALAMAAAQQWLAGEHRGKTVLVILSGGNIAPATYQQVWKKNYLEQIPAL